MKKHSYYILDPLHKSNLEELLLKASPILLLLAMVSIFTIKSIESNVSNNIQQGIASEIVRFHVIANSDSDQDQALKMEIKDAITESLKPELEKVTSIEDAREVLSNNLRDMEDLANEIIKSHGFTYSASASLERGYFPLKVYGDLSLPPGQYEALRIELGKAEGKNWWCIMFPPLCFVDSTYSVVPDSSKEQLKYVLTEEEFDSILITDEKSEEENEEITSKESEGSEENPEVKVKFKILTFLNDIFNLE